MINWNKMTIKASEAVQSAVEVAENKSNQQVEPAHLFLALINQEEGFIKPLLQKLGVNISSLKEDISNEIASLPAVSGADQVYISNDTKKALDYAFKVIKEFSDEYVSTEHLLLGIVENAGYSLRQILLKHGIEKKDLNKAIREVR